MSISIVIPAYNEEETIGEVICRVKNACEAEIIVVDDASIDTTATIAKKNGATVIKNPIRMGPSKAVYRGARNSHGELIVTIDADLDHYPEEIPKLLAQSNKGADIVIGERSSLPRLSEKILAYFTSKIIGISDPLSGFRVYRSGLLSVLDFGKTETYGMVFLAQAAVRGCKIVGIPVNSRVVRSKSRIGYSLKVDFRILVSGVYFFLYFLGLKK